MKVFALQALIAAFFGLLSLLGITSNMVAFTGGYIAGSIPLILAKRRDPTS
jgi:hypothetical protein